LFAEQLNYTHREGKMSAVDAHGHFNIPEGTITIVGRNPYRGGGSGADSWAKWEVDKGVTVRAVFTLDSRFRLSILNAALNADF
jgi:hypothetical protein